MAPRLTTALLAIVGAAVFGVVSTLAATDRTSLAAAVGPSGWIIPGLLSLIAVACLLLALTYPTPWPIFLGLALLGAAWLVGLPSSGGWHALTAVAGGWLLAVAELAYWSLDFRIAGKDERTIRVRRGATIAILVGAAVALSIVPELDLAATSTSSLGLTVVGFLGAAALVAVAAALAWRLRSAR
jgi:hypothetical protein